MRLKEIDKRSKVVDRHGKPLRVFHGTDKSFDRFLPASHFGTLKAAHQRLNQNGPRPGGHVRPVYLDITNPLRVTDAEASDEATLLHSIVRGKYPQLDPVIARREGAYAAAEAAGYDGLVYQNNMEDRGKDSWVTFRPEQVRSVFESHKISESFIATIDPNGDYPTRLYRNPSRAELTAALQRSKYRQLRGWLHHNLYVWDSYGGAHSQVPEEMLDPEDAVCVQAPPARNICVNLFVDARGVFVHDENYENEEDDEGNLVAVDPLLTQHKEKAENHPAMKRLFGNFTLQVRSAYS